MHEDSRIKTTITIPRRTNGTQQDTLSTPSLSELSEPPESESSEDADQSSNEVQSRPTRILPTRAAAAKGKSLLSTQTTFHHSPKNLRSRPIGQSTTQTTLPYSPQKLRTRPINQLVDESDDELASYAQDDVIHVIPARRSTRERKSTRTNLADDYVDEDGDSETDSEMYLETSRKRGKSKAGAKIQKRIRRGPVSRPAYGIFRSVTDLGFDAYEEEDTELLRAHRDICEKCHKAPAHAQLGKPKKGRKKAHKEDEDDFEEDEDDLVQSLGGWVRWYDLLI